MLTKGNEYPNFLAEVPWTCIIGVQTKDEYNYIKHICAKPSALSQNLGQLLPRMRRCIRCIVSMRAILISCSRPRPAPKGAGRGREYEGTYV